MTIELTAEHERFIEHAIHCGAYQDAKDVISAALEALAEELNEAPVKTAEAETDQRIKAIERLKTFGKTHGLSLGGITLRQLRDESRP